MERDPFEGVVSRAPRVDGARNRQALLDAATQVFAVSDSEPSMRQIAREAGVGIATLYRHFPTREFLVDAVYHDQVRRLTSGARQLLRRTPPSEALRQWMDLFANWLATKHGMLDTLRTMIDAGQISQGETRDELLGAIAIILDAGRAAGEIRGDVSAEDVATSLLGILAVTGRPEQRAQSARLLNLLLDGLRSRMDQPARG